MLSLSHVQAIDVIPNRLAFVWVRRPDAARSSALACSNIAYSIDEELVGASCTGHQHSGSPSRSGPLLDYLTQSDHDMPRSWPMTPAVRAVLR